MNRKMVQKSIVSRYQIETIVYESYKFFNNWSLKNISNTK